MLEACARAYKSLFQRAEMMPDALLAGACERDPIASGKRALAPVYIRKFNGSKLESVQRAC